MLKLGHIGCSFAFELVSFSIIQGWKVKGLLSIKILVLRHFLFLGGRGELVFPLKNEYESEFYLEATKP